MGVINATAFLQNEIMGWPPLVHIGTGFDLVTQNQWWDDEETPTTKGTAVPTSGEAGLDAKFLEVIKFVTNANNEGVKQTYTYSTQPRIKSGVHLSALVWVGGTGGGTGITVKLRNSDATATTGTSIATDGDWVLLKVEDHTCAGTSVELVITGDASGTFYCYPVCVMIGTDAVGLPPRHLQYRAVDSVEAVDLNSDGDTGGFIDVDLTSITSALAAVAEINTGIFDAAQAQELHVRRNGDTTSTASFATRVGQLIPNDAEITFNRFSIILDDAQIFEYDQNTTGTMDTGQIAVVGYWQWE